MSTIDVSQYSRTAVLGIDNRSKKPPVLSPAIMADPQVVCDTRSDGTHVLRSPQPLGPYPRHLCDLLRRWAADDPDRLFLAQRHGPSGELHRVTYGEARALVDRLAQGLLARGLVDQPQAPRPLLILSENSIDHALLTLAAMQAGVPVAAVSPAYSLLSADFAKLRAIHAVLSPGLVYAADDRYRGALRALALSAEEILTSDPASLGQTLCQMAAPLDATPEAAAQMEQRFAGLGPDSVAKVLFTSGSTGEPKGVLNTQRMLCSNQQALAQVWPFLSDGRRPPVLVDWLPWSHTFGANHNFNLALMHGGALHIDEGRPAPGLIERTVAYLREVSPTIYFNVPRGYDMLLPYLEADDALRESFFGDLDALFYAAAALPQPLWERLGAVAQRAGRARVWMLAAWGLTETSPMVTTVHFPIDRAGVIGLPAPGAEVKLVPAADRSELRVRGPCVTPGYWGRPDLAAELFDEEGFLRTGDAGKLLDEGAPHLGLVFDGRIAEDFKLTSGTWVHVGALRTELLAYLSPLVQDAVLTGHGRDCVGALLVPSAAACRACLLPDEPAEKYHSGAEVRRRVLLGLEAFNRDNPSSSRRIWRALILAEPPSIDAGEITDKGYLNQGAVLRRRVALVTALYEGDAADGEMLVPA